MRKYEIRVYATKKYRRTFRTLGLEWQGNNTYVGYVNADKIAFISSYCMSHKHSYVINENFSERSVNYRRNFFKKNPPQLGKYYFCAYCGRLRTRERITVDHLYPVAKARRSLKVQKKLKLIGCSSVNDIKNLVPACDRCNKRKGIKTGIWVLKGYIGKNKYYWYITHTVRTLLFITIAIFAYFDRFNLIKEAILWFVNCI